uniref:DNA polymerase III subunit gamma/tau n=1 Tax=candidate division WOR-3 bacterium TaxID=2052148 RepID=A0A7V3VTG2_UNCW3
MVHRVISLKYRPQSFNELTGQEHIVRSLMGAINSGSIGHAYLFAGPKGVGKTTTARIFAKSLNCINGPTVNPCQECPSCKEITGSRSIDVVEIDGASNRGIDEIRELRESIKYAPLHGRYKIYIIDEVHMLTNEAFNALLKTLEEPPPRVIFILATTNPSKVPATILSRCQRFIFKRLSINEISRRLKEIAQKEGIEITDRALYYLALRADGSIRDGESILEQLSSFVEGRITEEHVFKLIGFLGIDFYLDLINKIIKNDLAGMIILLNKGIEEGVDVIEIYKGLVGYLRKMLLARIGIDSELIEVTPEEVNLLKSINLEEARLVNLIEICLRYEDVIKRSINARIALELLFAQMVINQAGISKHKVTNENQDIFESQKVLTLKEQLCMDLNKRSPKLSAILRQTEVNVNGNEIEIIVNNDFQNKELTNNKNLLLELLNKITGQDVNLQFRLVEPKKKPSSIADTIIKMFDGEEVE